MYLNGYLPGDSKFIQNITRVQASLTESFVATNQWISDTSVFFIVDCLFLSCLILLFGVIPSIYLMIVKFRKQAPIKIYASDNSIVYEKEEILRATEIRGHSEYNLTGRRTDLSEISANNRSTNLI